MSDTNRMPIHDAMFIALDILQHLKPLCERIEIAGSVRRIKPTVGDIELVCVPLIKAYNDLLGKEFFVSQLDGVYLTGLGRTIKSGPRLKQFMLPEGIKFELYIVLPPAQWGVLYTIRTGPAEFSKWIVTQRSKGGCLPSDCRVKDGGVYRHDQLLPMPEEQYFLDFLGLGWVEPVDRADIKLLTKYGGGGNNT